MSHMPTEDWTQDDSLSEQELRDRMAAEHWEPVRALTEPTTSLEGHIDVGPMRHVWSHSAEVSSEQVRVPG